MYLKPKTMSSNFRSNRFAKHDQSEIILTPLNDDKVLETLKHLGELFNSCFGPNGCLKNIHNNSGGHVTVTSVSSRLIKHISFSHPIVRLIVSSIDSHLKNYMDSGHFTGSLCLFLVENFLKKGLHKRLIMDTMELILDEILSHMNLENSAKFKLNFSKTDDLIKLLNSAISTKPACGISEVNVNQVSRMILETFLNSAANNNVQFVSLEGYSIEESHIVDGLLYEIPQISTYRKSALNCKIMKDEDDYSEFIKVMIVDVSMAGDCNNFIDTVYQVDDFTEISSVIMDQLMDLSKYVVDNSIGVFACQKVVHPKIKKFLHEHNVFVVERLGQHFSHLFSDLTDAVCYSSLNVPVNEKHIGRLKGVRHCIYKNRSFVQFESKHCSNLCTVVLCNRNEEALQELKIVFETGLHILHLSMREPWCLYGAGCWQAYIAGFLMAKISVCANLWAEELGASELLIREICTTFISALYKSIVILDKETDHMVDNIYCHHWNIPFGQTVEKFIEGKPSCECKCIQYCNGMKFQFIGKERFNNFNIASDVCLEKREYAQVYDCFQSSMHGLQTAVATASIVLGVENIVQEK